MATSKQGSVQDGLHPSTLVKAPTLHATYPDLQENQTLYTVLQFAQAEPAFTAAALRNLIFKAEPRHSSMGEIPGNGLLECGAIVRLGRKVLIHRERFMEWAML